MGIGTGMINNAMQLGQQEQLQGMQIAGQKELSKYNSDLAFDMWNKTNYEAQRKHMEKAGLNVGLMYGGGAGGGATTNAGSAGSVSGGQASGESASKGMGMMLQSELQKAQIDNIEADTTKKQAETTEVESRTPTYEKGMEKTDSEIREIASKIGVNEEQIKAIIQAVKESEIRTDVGKATIPKIEAETNKIGAEASRIKTLTPIEAQKLTQEAKALTTKNIYLDAKEKAELDKVIQETVTMVKGLQMKGEEVDIRKFTEEMRADYPGLFNVAGKVIDTTMRYIIAGMSGEVDPAQREVEIKKR